MNEVHETKTFNEAYQELQKTEQEWIIRIKLQLLQNLNVGKPLGYTWLREKKLNEKRLYFITNEKTRKVVLLAIANKKDQQTVINHIILNKERYQKFTR